jgi:hypothetical protein
MNQTIIKSKSGIIIQCPPINPGIVKIILKSKFDLEFYYADKANIDHLKTTGNFMDKSGVIFQKKGNNFEDFITTMPGESFFVIVNNTENDSELSFEIKAVNYGSAGTSVSSGTNANYTASNVMSGYGTSKY